MLTLSKCVHGGGGEPKGRGFLSRGRKSWRFWIAKNKEGQKDIFLARGADGGTYCSFTWLPKRVKRVQTAACPAISPPRSRRSSRITREVRKGSTLLKSKSKYF